MSNADLTDKTVKIEISGSVMTITLDRPDVRNAFDDVMIAALTDAYRKASADDAVRIVVLQGAGPSFCAGADIRWMRRSAGLSREENITDARKAASMFQAVAACPKVTIARVHGAAMGGGAGAMAACDIAVAADDTMFAFSEVLLGIAPAVIAPYITARTGVPTARSLFVSGRRFDAHEAYHVRLIDEVVSPVDLDPAIRGHIDQILKASPKAIAATKELMRKMASLERADITEYTVNMIADLRVSEEGQEGLEAFLEKRKPGYSQ